MTKSLDYHKPNVPKVPYQEYPRVMYRGRDTWHLVNSDGDKLAALRDGWALSPDDVPPGPEPEVRRGPGRPRKEAA